jgi:hypothetical protein
MPENVGRFQVTPESLAALAVSTAQVRDHLASTPDLIGDSSAALGSSTVAAALDHFVHGWRDGRTEIGADVDALSQMLSQAASTYTSTDGDLAAAIPGSS